jgi:hypothetical protein
VSLRALLVPWHVPHLLRGLGLVFVGCLKGSFLSPSVVPLLSSGFLSLGTLLFLEEFLDFSQPYLFLDRGGCGGLGLVEGELLFEWLVV